MVEAPSFIYPVCHWQSSRALDFFQKTNCTKGEIFMVEAPILLRFLFLMETLQSFRFIFEKRTILEKMETKRIYGGGASFFITATVKISVSYQKPAELSLYLQKRPILEKIKSKSNYGGGAFF